MNVRLLMCIMLALGCDSPIDPSQETASVVFYTDAITGWSEIDILVEGQLEGTLTRYLSIDADCDGGSTPGKVVVIRPEGFRTYELVFDSGERRPGSIRWAPGICKQFLISCGEDRNCEN